MPTPAELERMANDMRVEATKLLSEALGFPPDHPSPRVGLAVEKIIAATLLEVSALHGKAREPEARLTGG